MVGRGLKWWLGKPWRLCRRVWSVHTTWSACCFQWGNVEFAKIAFLLYAFNAKEWTDDYTTDEIFAFVRKLRAPEMEKEP